MQQEPLGHQVLPLQCLINMCRSLQVNILVGGHRRIPATRVGFHLVECYSFWLKEKEAPEVAWCGFWVFFKLSYILPFIEITRGYIYIHMYGITNVSIEKKMDDSGG